MRRLFLTLLMSSILAFSSSAACFASTTAEGDVAVEYYSDGSYATIEMVIDEDTIPCASAAMKTKSATRTYTFYNANKQKAWAFSLKGTFQYNNTSATATASSCSTQKFISGWSCVSKRSSKAGATVKGSSTFKYLTLTKSVPQPFGMKCSAKGTISAL